MHAYRKVATRSQSLSSGGWLENLVALRGSGGHSLLMEVHSVWGAEEWSAVTLPWAGNQRAGPTGQAEMLTQALDCRSAHGRRPRARELMGRCEKRGQRGVAKGASPPERNESLGVPLCLSSRCPGLVRGDLVCRGHAASSMSSGRGVRRRCRFGAWRTGADAMAG